MGKRVVRSLAIAYLLCGALAAGDQSDQVPRKFLSTPQQTLKRTISIESKNQEKMYEIRIGKYASRGCPFAESLNLDGMRLGAIKNDLIRSDALQQVSLRDNYLDSIPQQLLGNVPHLSCLNLARNRINLYKANAAQHQYLRSLDLSYQSVTASFDRTNELQDSYETTGYEFMVFNSTAMHLPNLEYLDLSGNEISAVAHDFASSFPRLTYMNLAGINAVKLQPDFFARVPPTLAVLRMENNGLRDVTITHMAAITALYMDGNPLERIHIDSDKLRILSLTNCTNLRNVSLNTPNVEQLDLSSNRFGSMRNIHFVNLDLLHTLVLDNNKIPEITSSLRLQHLVGLSLRYNHIDYISAESFVYLTKLEQLSLKGNAIMNVDVRAFSGLNMLRTLDLSENQLSTITYGWTAPLENLQYLNLNSNLFTTIWNMAIDFSSPLQHLSVRNNKFRQVTTEELFLLPNMTLYIA